MSDVKLIVGVEESLSFDALNKGIKSIVDQINKTPPKIAVDIDEASIGRIRKTLSTLGKDIGVDLKFLNTISQQVGNTGKNAGSAFAKNFNGALSTLDTKVNTTADNIRNMELMLASNRIDTSSIKKVTKDLESMDIEIKRIHTDMNDNRMRLNISGVDELGRTVTVIKEFNYAADEISTIATHIDHAFDTSADAAKLFQKEVNSAFKSIKKIQEEINAYEFELVKLDPKADSKQISEIESKLKSKYKQFDDIYSVFGNSFSKEQTDQLAVSIANLGDKTDIWLSKLADNSKIKKTTEDIKEFLRLSKEVDKLEESSHKASLSGDKNLADSYNLDRSGKLARMDELLGSLYQDLPSDQFDKLIENAFSTSAALEHLDAKYQDTQDKLSQKIEAKVSNASFDLDIAKIDSGFKKLGDASHEKMPELASDIEQLKKLRELMSSQSGNELISTYERFNSLLEKIQNNLKIVSLENESTNMGESEKADALNKLSKLLAICKSRQEEWSAASKGDTKSAYDVYANVANAIEKLVEQINEGKLSIEDFKNAFKSLNQQVETSDSVIKGAGKNTKSFGSRLKDVVGVFAKWKSAAEIFQMIKRVAKELVQEVRAIDTAMTELKKVTDATESQYEKFLTNATNRAKELGATLVDTINASADMARLGYDLDEASALADSALVYKNVGDGISNIDEASSSIISTMQAFGIEAKNSMSIVDKFNKAGKQSCRVA